MTLCNNTDEESSASLQETVTPDIAVHNYPQSDDIPINSTFVAGKCLNFIRTPAECFKVLTVS